MVAERVHREHKWESGRKIALVSARWKYFHLTEHDDELYDLAADPHETENVIARHPDVAARMKREILDRLERERVAAPEVEISPEVREQLRALGYLE